MTQEKTAGSTVLGRLLMTVATLTYGVAPPLVDFGETHLLHPSWPGHARFHLMWLVLSHSAIAVIALCSLWLSAGRRWGIDLAGGIGLSVLGSFMLSAALMPFYAGALSDPGGVPLLGPVDANVVAFGFALILLAVGWFQARRKAI